MTDVQEKLENGYLLIRSIIEVMGAPKEHVEATLKKVVDDLKKAEKKHMEVMKEEYADAEEQKNKMFSAYVELEILVEDFSVLLDFCFNFMPSSLEILEPSTLSFPVSDLAGFINDLLARLHKFDMVVKNNNAKMKVIERNAVHLLRNNILILLKEKEKDLKELAKQSGIPEEQLNPFLAKLEKQGLIEKSGEKYTLKKR